VAITVDQADLGGSQALSSAATSITLTTTAAVAAGALVLVFSGGYGNTISSVTITNTGSSVLTWTTDIVDNLSPGSPGSPTPGISRAFAASGLSAGAVITATWNASSSVRTITAASILGVDTGDPIGNVAGPVGVSPAAQPWTTGSVSIEAGSILVGHNWNETTNSVNTPTSPSLEFVEVGHSNGFRSIAEYRIESSAGSYSVAGSWGATAQSTTVAAEYRAAAATGPDIEEGFAAPPGMFSPTLVEKGWWH
jgi:hypothetical protein